MKQEDIDYIMSLPLLGIVGLLKLIPRNTLKINNPYEDICYIYYIEKTSELITYGNIVEDNIHSTRTLDCIIIDTDLEQIKIRRKEIEYFSYYFMCHQITRLPTLFVGGKSLSEILKNISDFSISLEKDYNDFINLVLGESIEEEDVEELFCILERDHPQTFEELMEKKNFKIKEKEI